MVSQKFVENLYHNIGKELKDIISGPPRVKPLGSSEDQYKGFGDELATSLIPFRKSQYEAQESLLVRVPVRNPHFSFFDITMPIVNVKGRSVQGIASFATSIPYSIPETFVERMVRLSYRLLPYKLIVEKKMKPKEVLKKKMIKSHAVNAINADKKFCNTLHGFSDCKVYEPGLSSKYYKIKIDWLDYPPGMFSIVPYKGHSILLSKEAGDADARVDSPSYPFKERFAAFSGVAKHIAANPQAGDKVGIFYMDSSMEILLPPLLKSLKAKDQ